MNRLTLIFSLLMFFESCLAAAPSDLSPDGKIGIDGSYSDLFFVDVETGKKLCPLFSPFQQGQISNVEINVKWSASGDAVAIRVFYGTRRDEILFFSRRGETIKPVTVHEPDLSRAFGTKLGDGEVIGADEDMLGSWVNSNTVEVIFGEAKMFDSGTRHFLVPSKVTILNGKASIKYGDLKVLSDDEFHLYTQDMYQ